MIITGTLLQSKIVWLVFVSILLLGLLIHSRLPVRQFLHDVWFWMALLASDLDPRLCGPLYRDISAASNNPTF
jgi:hypothetical protein